MENQNEIDRARLAFGRARTNWTSATTEAYRKWEDVKKNLELPVEIQRKIEREEELTDSEVERILFLPTKEALVAQVFGKVDGELRERMREALERLIALSNA